MATSFYVTPDAPPDLDDDGKPRFTRPAQTAAYRPTDLGSRLGQLLDGRPRFTWMEAERMRYDPQVQMGLRILRAPLYGVTVKVQADSSKVERWVQREFTHIYNRMLPRLSRQFEYGCAAGEITYCRQHGRVHFEDFLEVHPRDAKPLYWQRGRRAGKLAGLRVDQIQDGRGSIYLDPQHGFWFKGDASFGQWYGHPRMAGAHEPWFEKKGRHGAVESRRLFMKKMAFRGPQMRYPVGHTNMARPGDPDHFISNQDIAREIVEKFENGGVIALPNVKTPDKDFAWAWEDPKAFADAPGILDYPKQLDREILIGMGIPPELVDAATVGSGYSGRAIPAQVFFSSMDEEASRIIEAIDRQIIRPLVRLNFGKQGYEIKPDSLAQLISGTPPGGQQPGAGGAGQSSSPAGPPAAGPNGMVPYTGPHGGHGFMNPATHKISYDGRGNLRMSLNRTAKKLNRRARRALRTSRPALTPDRYRKLVILAMCKAQLDAHAAGNPHAADAHLHALADLLADPHRAAKVLRMSWVGATSQRGHMMAIGEAEHQGQVLYGQRAAAALRSQEKRPDGESAESATARGEDAVKHARAARVKALSYKATPEDFRALAKHLPLLPIHEVRATRDALGVSFRNTRQRDALVASLLSHVQELVDTKGGDQWNTKTRDELEQERVAAAGGAPAGDSAPPPTGVGNSLENFAKQVQSAADSEDRGHGDNKVFNHHIFEAMQKQDPSLTREEFNTKLIEASRKRLVSMSRADLTNLMHPDDVKDSTVMDRGGMQNFVLAANKDRKRRNLKTGEWEVPKQYVDPNPPASQTAPAKPFNPADHVAAVDAAFDANQHPDGQNLVGLDKIRAGLSHLSREQQDAVIHHLRKSGKYQAKIGEGFSSPEEKAAGIPEDPSQKPGEGGSGLFVHLARNKDYKPAEKSGETPPAGVSLPPAAKEPHEMSLEEFGDYWKKKNAATKQRLQESIASGGKTSPVELKPGMRNAGTPEENLKAARTMLDRLEKQGEQTPEELANNHRIAKMLAGMDDTATLEPMSASPPATAVKEPHEMTRRAHHENEVATAVHPMTGKPYKKGPPEWLTPGRSALLHRQAVEAALAAGKPVPPEVLADYPDLAAKSNSPPPPGASSVLPEVKPRAPAGKSAAKSEPIPQKAGALFDDSAYDNDQRHATVQGMDRVLGAARRTFPDAKFPATKNDAKAGVRDYLESLAHLDDHLADTHGHEKGYFGPLGEEYNSILDALNDPKSDVTPNELMTEFREKLNGSLALSRREAMRNLRLAGHDDEAEFFARQGTEAARHAESDLERIVVEKQKKTDGEISHAEGEIAKLLADGKEDEVASLDIPDHVREMIERKYKLSGLYRDSDLVKLHKALVGPTTAITAESKQNTPAGVATEPAKESKESAKTSPAASKPATVATTTPKTDPLDINDSNVHHIWEHNRDAILQMNPKMSESLAGHYAAARILNGVSNRAGEFINDIDEQVKNGEKITDDEDAKYIAASDAKKSIYNKVVSLSGYRPGIIDKDPMATDAIDFPGEEASGDKLKRAISHINVKAARDAASNANTHTDDYIEKVRKAELAVTNAKEARRTAGSRQPEARNALKALNAAMKTFNEASEAHQAYVRLPNVRKAELEGIAVDESQPNFVRVAAADGAREKHGSNNIREMVGKYLEEKGFDPRIRDAVAVEVSQYPMRGAKRIKEIIDGETTRQQMMDERKAAKEHVATLKMMPHHVSEAEREADSIYAGGLNRFKEKWTANAERHREEQSRQEESKKKHQDLLERELKRKEAADEYIYTTSILGKRPEAVAPDVLNEVAARTMNAPAMWHAGDERELPKAMSAKAVVEKVGKDSSTRFALAKAITDHGWATDSKFAVKATPAMIEQAKALGYDKLEGRTPNMAEFIEGTVKKPAEVASVVATRINPENGVSNVLLRSDDGEAHAVVDGQMLANIKAVYPDAVIKVSSGTSSGSSPVTLFSKGEPIGLIMPLSGHDEVPKVSDSPRPTIGDVLAPGPYKVEDIEETPTGLHAGRGNNAVRLEVSKPTRSSGFVLKMRNKELVHDREYGTQSEAIEAGKNVLAHAHGMDDEGGLIFKPKGEKPTELEPDEKKRHAYYTKMRDRVADAKKVKPVKKDGKEYLPVGEHFGVEKSVDDKGKSDGWKVTHLPTGLQAGSWRTKDIAIGHGLMLNEIPGWGEFDPKGEGKHKEMSAGAAKATKAFEENELPEHAKAKELEEKTKRQKELTEALGKKKDDKVKDNPSSTLDKSQPNGKVPLTPEPATPAGGGQGKAMGKTLDQALAHHESLIEAGHNLTDYPGGRSQHDKDKYESAKALSRTLIDHQGELTDKQKKAAVDAIRPRMGADKPFEDRVLFHEAMGKAGVQLNPPKKADKEYVDPLDKPLDQAALESRRAKDEAAAKRAAEVDRAWDR